MGTRRIPRRGLGRKGPTREKEEDDDEDKDEEVEGGQEESAKRRRRRRRDRERIRDAVGEWGKGEKF